MIDEERQIYIDRMRKQYDDMLNYHTTIQEQIDVKQKELKTVELQLVKVQEAVEKTVKDHQTLREKHDFETRDWSDQLAAKDKRLVDQEDALRISVGEFEQLKTEIDNKVVENSVLLVKIQNERALNELEAIKIDQEYANITAKTANLAQREAKIVENEAKITEKFSVITAKEAELALLESGLKLERASIEAQKIQFEDQQKQIDADRNHLYSQQEAFRLAVREAKSRWQM